MKTITLTIVLFLSFTLIGNAQKNKTQSAEKALSILLADYTKTIDLKSISLDKFIMYLSKKKLSTKGMKIQKVKQLIYLTSKKEKRTIYLIQHSNGIGINARVSDFNSAIFARDSDTEEEDPDCEIITTFCEVEGNCEYVCVITNTCDGSNESDPNCCEGASCDEEDGITNDLMTPLETLMG